VLSNNRPRLKREEKEEEEDSTTAATPGTVMNFRAKRRREINR
jgi:hypothetical protein